MLLPFLPIMPDESRGSKDSKFFYGPKRKPLGLFSLSFPPSPPNQPSCSGQKLSSIKGFTIIEMIVAIVILGILGVYTFSFLGDSMGAYVRVKSHKTLYDEGRLALEFMAREMADANQKATISTTSSSITFSKLHPSPTTVTYSLTGGTLNRVSASTDSLAGNVQTFTTSVSGTAPQQTVTLELLLIGPGEIRFRTTIYPRNNA